MIYFSGSGGGLISHPKSKDTKFLTTKSTKITEVQNKRVQKRLRVRKNFANFFSFRLLRRPSVSEKVKKNSMVHTFNSCVKGRLWTIKPTAKVVPNQILETWPFFFTKLIDGPIPQMNRPMQGRLAIPAAVPSISSPFSKLGQ